MMNDFLLEITQQPYSLRQLVRHYREAAPDSLERLPQPARPVMTGMGASYHAALIAACHLQSAGVPAVAIQASELLYYGRAFLADESALVCISQSGASGEVRGVLEACSPRRVLLGITNDGQSPLATGCQHWLPLVVDEERLVATKTYTNTAAILWLLARTWTRTDGREFGALLQIADWIEEILVESQSIIEYWLESLGPCASLICTGYGPQAATALQSAQTLSEWVKTPVLGIGGGALRHGFAEVADGRTGFVVFASSGRTQVQAQRLIAELRSYGSRVVAVENGVTLRVHRPKVVKELPDEFLAPLLDVIPVELVADALARQRGVAPGFRHIDKVASLI